MIGGLIPAFGLGRDRYPAGKQAWWEQTWWVEITWLRCRVRAEVTR